MKELVKNALELTYNYSYWKYLTYNVELPVNNGTMMMELQYQALLSLYRNNEDVLPIINFSTRNTSLFIGYYKSKYKLAYIRNVEYTAISICRKLDVRRTKKICCKNKVQTRGRYEIVYSAVIKTDMTRQEIEHFLTFIVCNL